MAMIQNNYGSNPNLLSNANTRLSQTPGYKNMDYEPSPYAKEESLSPTKFGNRYSNHNSALDLSTHQRNLTLEPVEHSYNKFLSSNPIK